MTNVRQCQCGSYNMRVTDSREHGAEIWRTRVCDDCGRRIYTTEVCRDDLEKIHQIAKAVRKIKEGMELLDEMGQ